MSSMDNLKKHGIPTEAFKKKEGTKERNERGNKGMENPTQTDQTSSDNPFLQGPHKYCGIH